MTSLFTRASFSGDYAFSSQRAERGDHAESGLYVPLVAMMIFALIAVVGLAVDGGHLQQSRLELQKATDAAAVAAAKKFALVSYEYRTDGGATETEFRNAVGDLAREVVRANMVANHGFDAATVTTTLDLDQETVRVEGKWNVDLYILGHFPGYTPQMAVRVVSKSQVRKAMTSMVMDTSYSMICPARNPDCTCSRQAPFVCNNPRAIHMIWAMQDFASLFNPNRDMFDITWFSVAARTDLDMCNRVDPSHPCVSGGFNYQALFDHADSILLESHIQGSTNTCDGLFRSYIGTLQPTYQQHRSDVARVLFTDGAPAAARFFFSDPSGLPVNNPRGWDFTNHDYYNWAVDWLTHEQFFGNDPSRGIPGCTALGKATIPYSWPRGAIPDFDANQFFPADPGAPNSWHRTVPCSISDQNDPTRAFTGCLSTFGFVTPDGKVWGRSIPFSAYRQHYYHCAIAMSDFLRKDGSIVYGIAVGATPPANGDPYQDVLDDSIRKDCLMTRLSDDPNPAGASCGADFPGEFKKDAANNSSLDFQQQGKYLFAQHADNLYDLYTAQLYPRLARKLKTAVLIEDN